MNEMNEIWLDKKYAECYELDKDAPDNQPGLRIYRGRFPDGYILQIRTHAPINGCYDNGKPRNMIAHLNVTVAEMREIIHYMETEA